MDDIYLLGLDIGTSGCKAVVFEADGRQITSAYREYSVIHPREGWMELVPELVVDSIFDCIHKCAMQCKAENIKAVAVSSQGEAIIPVGVDGKALANSIVTFDNRNKDEYEWFSKRFEKKKIMQVTGAPTHTMFTITKILWIRNNMPEVFSKTWKFMCFGDFISYRLGAQPVIDYSMASRTMAFDIIKKKWSEEILSECGIPLSKMPDVVPSAKVIGNVCDAAAALTGLHTDISIVSGGHDQACCAVGAGVFSSGIAMDSLGTTESIVCVNDKALITPAMIENNLPCYVYPVNSLYAYLSFLSSSGAILKWFRDSFMPIQEGNVFKMMDKAVMEKYHHPSGLMVLPHFAGSGTPYLDFNSKGIIVGLTLSTDKYQLYKAIIEGTNLEARINIECMEQSGIVVNELRCVGGGAKSPLWLQLKADITGKTVVSSQVDEFGCLGAAILAGLGVGVFNDASEASGRFLKDKQVYVPRPESQVEYEEVYKSYKNLYVFSKQLSLI